MNELETKLFKIANDTVGNILNNGEESSTINDTFIKFAVITNNLDNVAPIWTEWINSYNYLKTYSVDEEDTITDLQMPNKFKTGLLWKKYPEVKEFGDKYRITSRLLITRLDN